VYEEWFAPGSPPLTSSVGPFSNYLSARSRRGPDFYVLTSVATVCCPPVSRMGDELDIETIAMI
jgi:hypothetical protein